MSKRYTTVAKYIDKIYITYECIHCNQLHRHGSVNDFCSNRSEPRKVDNCPIYKGEVDIIINDETKRILNKRDMKIYNNYLKNQGS